MKKTNMDYCSIFKRFHKISLILGINYFRISGNPFQRTYKYPLKWNILIAFFYTSYIAMQVARQFIIQPSQGIIEIPLRIALVS